MTLAPCRLCAGSHPPGSVGHFADPCEWNPGAGRSANCADAYHGSAAVIVGADGKWRLCVACAALSRFRRFTKRTAVREKQGAEK